MNPTILVAGGTGVMGTRIVKLLHELFPHLSTVVGVHRTLPAEGTPTVRWDHHDPRTQREALRNVRVLIDAAGPYTRDPRQTIRLCQELGVHYVDLAESPKWFRTIRRLEDKLDAAVVPGASTVPGLVEVLFRERHEQGTMHRITIDLLMATGQAPGRGMLRSLLSPLGKRDESGNKSFGALQRRRGQLYGSFPCPKMFMNTARPINTTFGIGFDQTAMTRSLRGLATCASILHMPLESLSRVIAPVAKLASGLGSTNGRLDVEAFDASNALLEHVVIHATKDPLEVPALPAVLTAAALVKEGTWCHGYNSVAELVTRDEMVAAIKERGGRVDVMKRTTDESRSV